MPSDLTEMIDEDDETERVDTFQQSDIRDQDETSEDLIAENIDELLDSDDEDLFWLNK